MRICLLYEVFGFTYQGQDYGSKINLKTLVVPHTRLLKVLCFKVRADASDAKEQFTLNLSMQNTKTIQVR